MPASGSANAESGGYEMAAYITHKFEFVRRPFEFAGFQHGKLRVRQ